MRVALLLMLAGVLAGQTPAAPELQIVAPTPDSYLSGTTVMRATLSPSDGAARVLFSIDGREVCDISAPPFECSWEAGGTIVAHQIRIVAELKGGGRVIKTLRTKALGYAEKVDVEVVQVIATVMDG